MKKRILKTALTIIPFIVFAKEPANINNLEKNVSGTFLIETVTKDFPAFPKVTFCNENDTITYFGDVTGQIKYQLPKGRYNIKIEPGTDPRQGVKGDYFMPYETSMNVDNNLLGKITPEKSDIAKK